MILSHSTGHPLRYCAAVVLAGCLCGAAGDSDPSLPAGATDSRTMVVTTDSSAYCRTLSGAIEQHGALPREVKELKAQGDGLCDEGQVRSGISRLRRALLALTSSDRTSELDSP